MGGVAVVVVMECVWGGGRVAAYSESWHLVHNCCSLPY